jgi:hypothetical protein
MGIAKNLKRINGSTRPIRSERDYAGAASVVKQIGSHARLGPEDELRMRSLIREMEKFENQDDDSPDDSHGAEYVGNLRRWSDDASNPD